MENFNMDLGNKKIIEQLPKGVSMEDFWKAVKLNEMKEGRNYQERIKKISVAKKLTEGLYTDKVIEETIEQIKKAENLPKFLENINKEYKGGE